MSDHATPPDVTYNARFAPARAVCRQARVECGRRSSSAVHIDSEMVVDLWGHWAYGARTVLRTENTITCVFSTSTTMTALVRLGSREHDFAASVDTHRHEFVAGATRESSFASCGREG